MKVIKGLVIILFLVGVINFASASLGISPAGQKINFVPGQGYEFAFTVLSDHPEREIELYLVGDLAEYATLSKTKVFGTENFRVSIVLPTSGISPGRHDILVRAQEFPPESEFIGSKIDIGVPIKIFVPYPGRYAELQLNIPDINIGEEIPVEILAVNRGREKLDLTEVYVDFFTNNEKVGTLSYTPVSIAVAEERYFRKSLNTVGYKAGDYFAVANLNYGEIASVNKTFRIGSLFVNITNFTEELPQKGIQKFDIGIESLWNKDIGEVFAEVNLSRDSENFGFRTPPIDLPAWQKKTLEGFLDTSGLSGNYDLDITLRYNGEKTSAKGKLRLYKYSSLIVEVVIISIVLAIAGIFVLVWYLKKRYKKKR